MAEKQRKRSMEETSSDSNKMAKTTLTLELPSDFEGWNEEELGDFLGKWKNTVEEKKITVARLNNPTDPELKGLGMSIFKPQTKVECKVFNDPIHGHVELHPLLVKIIHTPQFDRLRHIKQLGGAYHVFPGASHNRFEHSIGVAHLAGEFAKALQSKQPELSITDRDILCVQIAGLCHDLGHGPFSHLFERMFITKAEREKKEEEDKNKDTWKHEKNSRKMFLHMVEQNNLEEEMRHCGLEPEEDKTFIQEMMTGEPLEPATGDQPPQWLFKGRGEDMSFLYEIVANHENEIDVDKFDYFARDCHHLGIQNHFDHQRFFQFARVCEVEEKKGKGKKRKHICVRDKEVHNLYEMFYARCSFHRKAYQHKVNKLIETMIIDAFIEADNASIGPEEQTFTLSTAIDDMEAYTKLTDEVFEKILYSSCDELKGARDILERIIKRDLYKCVGTIVTTNKEMTKEVKKRWNESTPIGGLTKDDFALVVTCLDYGYGEKDPISRVRFYSKEKPDEAKPIPRDEVSRLLPEHFSEGSVRVYLKKKENDEKKNEKNLADAKKHFEKVFTTKDFEVKEGLVARPTVKTSSPKPDGDQKK